MAGVTADFFSDAPRFFVFLERVFIDLTDGRAWDYIMELVAEDDFPSFCKGFLLLAGQTPLTAGSHCGKPLRIPVQVFQAAVHPLIIGVAGVCPTVVFQIQLAIPFREICRCRVRLVLQFFKIPGSVAMPDTRQAGQTVNDAPLLQFLPVDTAPAVTVAVSHQQFGGQVLVPVVIPDTGSGPGNHLAVISIVPGSLFFRCSRRCDEMGQDFCSVNPYPVKGVMGHLVAFIPTDFCGYECIQAGLLQYLWQGP